MYIVGIDPDCKKSGFAFYGEGKLLALRNWDFKEFTDILINRFNENGMNSENTVFVVEDGTLIKTIYKKHRDDRPNVYAEKARNVGRVQQMGLCLIDFIESLGYQVIREKPQRGNWAENEGMFKCATAWKKRSNPETRSAAYFAFLHKDKLFL